jgi:hypothetical protein
MVSSTICLAAVFVLLWNSGFIGAEYGLPFPGPFTLLFWRYWALTFILLIYLTITMPAIGLEGLATRWEPTFMSTMVWLIFGVSLSAYAFLYLKSDTGLGNHPCRRNGLKSWC